MPRIAGVPDLGVVERPYMNPRIAGRPGEAVAELADVGFSAAMEGLNLEGHMRRAQEHVDTIAAQNDYNAAYVQFQADLKKTVNSRDVPELTEHYHDELNEIAKRWSKSPASVQIQMQGDRLRPEMAADAQTKQVDLQRNELIVQAKIQKESLIPQYVTAKMSNDPEKAQAILDHFTQLYNTPLIGDEERELAINQFHIEARDAINEAVFNSPIPAERQAAIKQMKSKGSEGPVDTTNFSEADFNANLTFAESRDRELNNLAKSQNLNTALGIKASLQQQPQFKGEEGAFALIHAFQDGKFLQKNNIVTPTGEPDYEMGAELIKQTESDLAVLQKEQTDRNNKIQDEFPDVMKMTDPQIEQMVLSKGGDHRAVSALKTERKQETARRIELFHFQQSMGLAQRQQKEREIDEASADKAAEIGLEIQTGKVYEPLDIRTMDGLSKRDKMMLIQDIKSGGVLQNPYVKNAGVTINDLPLQQGDKDKLWRIFMEQTKAGDLRGSAITQAANDLIERAKKSDAMEWINNTFSHLGSRTLDTRTSTILRRGGAGSPSAPPEGFDGKVKAKDGWHWANSSTHEIGPRVQ